MQDLILSPDHLVVAGVTQTILMYSFRGLFFLSAILLIVIILLQEGKGGGLASALGGQGAETFGVATGGVNKVTLTLAGLFLVSALGHALTTGGVIAAMKKAAPVKSAQEEGDTLKDIEEDGGKPPLEEDKAAKEKAPPKDPAPPKDTTPKDTIPPKDQGPPK